MKLNFILRLNQQRKIQQKDLRQKKFLWVGNFLSQIKLLLFKEETFCWSSEEKVFKSDNIDTLGGKSLQVRQCLVFKGKKFLRQSSTLK